MKKILSLICAAAVAMSMMAVTVSAAVTKPTVTTEYVDLSAKDDADYHYVGVKVTVEYPFEFGLDYDYDNDDNEIYDGYCLAGLTVTFDLGEGYTFNKKNSTVNLGSAAKYGTNGALINFNAVDMSTIYDGDSLVDVGTVAFRIAKTATADERAIACAGTNKDLVTTVWSFDWAMAPTNEYPYQTSAQMDYVGGTIPAYGTITPSVEVATSGAWDTGSGILVIGKVTGEATEKGITIAGYTLPEVSSDKGMGPNFVATAPASAQGYYGVYIAGIEAGTYTVNAYADTAVGATTSVEKK